MNGRLSVSESSFHSPPSRFEISELCIFGFSCAIFRRWPRDHTIKAFIGRFTLFGSLESSTCLFELFTEPLMLLLCGGVGLAPSSDPWERVGEDLGSWVCPWWDLYGSVGEWEGWWA